MGFVAWIRRALSPVEQPPHVRRGPGWWAVRKAWLAVHDSCASCGGKPPAVELEVHHIIPLSHGGDELDRNNLITLCRTRWCHFRDGHLWDWRAANPHVVRDSANSLARLAQRVYPGANR